MSELSCPNCGAPVPFVNKASVYAVCPNCRTLSLKNDLNLEKIGTSGELADDNTLLKIGTEGTFRNKNFRVLGRIQLKFDLGFWNEWYVAEDGGNTAWIGEAQGTYFYTKLDSTIQPNLLPQIPTSEDGSPILAYEAGGKKDQLTPGDTFTLRETWTLKEIMTAECVGGEGELPIGFETGYTAVLLDLANEEGRFATIDYSESPPLFFLGDSATYEELHLRNLKENAIAYGAGQIQARSIQCVGCGASISQLRPDFSKSIACEYCGTVMDTERDDLKVIAKFEKVSKEGIFLPLGTPIKLPNRPESKVLGILRKSTEEDGETFEWTDYLLHYPGGYAWLNENGLNWTYFEPLLGIPKWAPGLKRIFGKEKYAWYGRSDSNTDLALGEFYWKVQAGEKAEIEDFTSPPYMLSSERTDREIFWSKGTFVPFDQMKEAVPLEVASKLQRPEDIGACEPNPFKIRLKRNLLVATALTIAFFGFQVYGCLKSKNLTVFEGTFNYTQTSVPGTDIGSPNYKDNSFVTDVFEIPGSPSDNVEIQLEAPSLDNKYMYFSLALIDADTDTAYDTSIETSYYHGVDDGESWSEGSKSDSKSLAEIPPGHYYLRLETQSDFRYGAGAKYKVKVIRDVMSPAPFFLFGILLWIPLIYTFFRSYSFESKRG
ncbi:PF13785 domain protein [Leptospira fainei serovar Hurstbridge str. BUT 6]|uniref:PF13785 domain protein n=1 Tax=Leptospira fainei serovar Hurstbridge str. BUT 6 TaxID=1193011 RepID=S3US61_9LEPT|nr:DUF4178 domain-containing protein [Leptospira fainei]EPG73241.1 PF13785 domain protein [Leptospira fainei serovar Hurstbridge str. BUT 6]